MKVITKFESYFLLFELDKPYINSLVLGYLYLWGTFTQVYYVAQKVAQ